MNSWVFFINICMIFAFAKSMSGGWKNLTDLNSPEIQNNSQKAAALVSESIDSENYMKLVNVMKAKKQIVAGTNYEFEMIIVPTQCKKSENLTEQQIKDCPLQQCGKPLQCIARMWVQLWKNSYTITNFNCQPGVVQPSC